MHIIFATTIADQPPAITGTQYPAQIFSVQCSPVRRTVSQSDWYARTPHTNPHIEFTYAIGRQGQSFRLFLPFGQMYRGFENPRLFKDRPTDGKRSGVRRTLLNPCGFNSAGNHTWSPLHLATCSAMVLRIIFATTITDQPPAIIGTQYSASAFLQNRPHTTPAQIFANQCSPVRRTVSQ